MYKVKIKFSYTDTTELFGIICIAVNELNELVKEDRKEISIYRLDSMMRLHNRFQKKINESFVKKISISFILPEMLTLRYVLLRRRTTPQMGDLFCRIDSRIHPSMYERKEL